MKRKNNECNVDIATYQEETKNTATRGQEEETRVNRTRGEKEEHN